MNADYFQTTVTNCICIGIRAGVELPDDSDGVVILGDNVTSLDRTQPNVLFLGKKCVIGETLFGQRCNLKEILDSFISL